MSESLTTLAVTRKDTQAVLIDGSIRVQVVVSPGTVGRVRLRITAPHSTHIVREELQK